MLVVCAILIENGKVLVTKRPPGKNQGGKWEFPGGKVQDGETPEESIFREIVEELDISVRVGKRLGTIVHRYPDFTIELMPLCCSITDGSIRLHEHTEARWVTISELGSLPLCDADRLVLPRLKLLL